MTPDGRMMSVAEVAAALGFDPETIRRAIRRGELEASKPSGRIRIDPAAVQAWLQDTRVDTGEQPAAPAATARPRAPSSAASVKPARRTEPRERRSFRDRVREPRTT